jgi:hypothetical protein
MGWNTQELGVRFPVVARDFSLLHNVQTGTGAHPPSYRVGAGGKEAEV